MISILSHLKRNKETLLKGGMYSVFSFFNQGIGFFILIILAKFISPEEFGQLSLFNTVVMLLGYVIALSTEGYISISYFKNKDEDFKKDIGVIFLISTIVFLILFLILLSFSDYLGLYLNLTPKIIFTALLICLFQIFVNLFLNYKRVSEKILHYGLYSCTFAIFNFILTLLFVSGFNLNWIGRVYANAICVVLFGVVSLLFFFGQKLVSFNFDKYRISKVLLWGIPIIPHLATTWIRQGCDRYIINYNYTLTEVGVFSFALTLASVLEIIGSAFNSTNSVQLFKILSNSNLNTFSKLQKLRDNARINIVLFVVLMILIVFFCIVVIPLFFNNYSKSIPYFVILVLYAFLRCIYFLYCNYFFYWSETKTLMKITVSCSILHFILSIIFTRYSLYFTASIYILSQFLLTFWVYAYSRNLIKNKLYE